MTAGRAFAAMPRSTSQTSARPALSIFLLLLVVHEEGFVGGGNQVSFSNHTVLVIIDYAIMTLAILLVQSLFDPTEFFRGQSRQGSFNFYDRTHNQTIAIHSLSVNSHDHDSSRARNARLQHSSRFQNLLHCKHFLPYKSFMSSSQMLLKLSNIALRYNSGGGAEPVSVLKGVSLEVARGESLAIIGPSGSGKSTLLNIIGTLDRPTSGEVLLAGQDLSRLDDAQLAAVRNRQIGFIFQAHHLLPQCSVLENVLVPTLATADAALRQSAPKHAARLLKRVGLESRMTHRPGQLSGGERQRVAVVRALINQPQLLLADEPTGALDRASADQLATLLLELNREENVTLIVVTHALDLAHKMGRVMELRDGVFEPVMKR
ncbi:MAG: transporter ATP-binding protein [Pedosphaera sp.]|nr:transporter ATP-binding protein [Pedosphaera sp.]